MQQTTQTIFFLRAQFHSVETPSSPWSAAFIVCHAKLAHFTRAGYFETPENTASFPSLSASPPCGPSVTNLWTPSNNCSASARVLPRNASVNSDADDVEIAQPDP